MVLDKKCNFEKEEADAICFEISKNFKEMIIME